MTSENRPPRSFGAHGPDPAVLDAQLQAFETSILLVQAEAIIERDKRINYWLDRYNPVDWFPLIIAAVVVWAALV